LKTACVASWIGIVVNIAFLNLCKRDWIAGCNYYRNLFTALKAMPNPPRLVLVDLGDTTDDTYHMLLPLVDDVLVYPPRRSPWRRAHYRVQRALGLGLGAHNPLHDLLVAAGVDVLFTAKSAGPWFGLPQLIWLPDFQHVRLPHLFTPEDRHQRDQRYRQWARDARRIVLSSEDARHDLQGFAPQAAHKARVLHFVAALADDTFADDPAQVAADYRLPERFFYLPNQWWVHKNHQIVIEALARLNNPAVVVVCSGSTHDYRQPDHHAAMLRLADALGVQAQVRVLGMIPQRHIWPLMRQSLAVVQPSRFEGWSTTVEEVKSLGKTIVLSDIAVHREQAPPAAHYFAVDDAAGLAQALGLVWALGTAGPDAALETAARAAFAGRQQAFAAQFMAIVGEVV
jgi:glycosyltransferase involved in cell wall biosynthesis